MKTHSFIAATAASLLLVVLAGCAKKPETEAPKAVTLVQGQELSRHFETVNSHLELGGTLYGFVDVDGDALELAGSAQAVVKQLATLQPQMSMFAKQDFKVLFEDLGLNDVKAIGLSSVKEAGGTYRNRAFLYTPEGRHGLFKVFGGQPGRFVGARLAPKDVDFYAEHEFDVEAVYQTVKELIAKVNGPDAAAGFEKTVRSAGEGAHFSLLDIVQGLNGRATFIVRLDPEKNITIPGPQPLKLPAFSILVRVDGVGPAFETALTSAKAAFVPTQEGTLHLYTSKQPTPIEGLKMVVAVDGKALYAATSPEFLHECLNRTEGLDSNPDFVSALAALGPEGNGLTWVTPRFFSRIKALPELNAQASPQALKLMDLYAANFPNVSQPLLSVRTNLPDGILVRSVWNRSLKADVAMLTVYNPVTVGLLAAMAIPAFQKVRLESQNKAVTNNLRMLSAAADQFYLEKGVSSATYGDLVGPDKLLKTLVPVMGEDYHQVVFSQGRPLAVRLPDGRVIRYPMGLANQARMGANDNEGVAQVARVMTNIMLLDAAAKRYYEEKGVTSTSFRELMSEDTHPDIRPVLGEDYNRILFERGVPLQIRLPNGRMLKSPAGRFVRRPGDEAIEANLALLGKAAERFYAAQGATSVTFEDLVGPGKLVPQLTPVADEDYHGVLFRKDHALRLHLKDGRILFYIPEAMPLTRSGP